MINQKKIDYYLKDVFKLDKFRKIQKDIIYSVLNNNNTLGIMPTGGGKSLTYQIAGLYLPGTTIVISPLISLMKDQVDFLNKNKINSIFYNGSLTNEEKQDAMQKIKDGNLKFIFIAPERLFVHENFDNSEDFLTLLQKYITINLITIDEAHCISSWGHDFREDYLRLKELIIKLPNIPILTLTATADPITKQEIIDTFNISDKNVFTLPIERTNLIYNIEKKYSKGYEQTYKIIQKNKTKKGIVYCFKKDDVNKLTRELKRKGIKAEPYHADLKDTKKSKVLENFLNDKLEVVVATIAFGMGINKSNIGYIIHTNIPKNIESYYQETGRAGRDGKLAKVYFLYSGRDYVILNWLLNNSNRKWIEKVKLNWMKRYTTTTICRKQSLSWYFEDITGKKCEKCDICKNKFLFQKKDKNFIKFINDNLTENNLFSFEKIIEENFEKKLGLDYLYQLIFNNKIKYDRKTNQITLIDNVNDNFLFNEPLDINDNFPVTIKKRATKRKKTTRKRTTTRKSTTKTTTGTKTTKKPLIKKKKRTLSKEQIKKMQEGRKKAAAKKKK